jgi:DNA-binding HxlR family transcriptional regulator
VSAALEVLGDRWSLLIVRDMMVRGFSTFHEFQGAGEGIATNILSDRLLNLRRAGVIAAQRDTSDRRSVRYRLTAKGIDLAPLVLELLLWGAKHEPQRRTRGPAEGPAECGVMAQMAENRAAILAEVRQRWEAGDRTPLQVNGQWMLQGLQGNNRATTRRNNAASRAKSK